jgi:translation initiation factor IF-3
MGREMAHQELGVQLLNKVIQGLQDISILEVPPKFEGKQMYLILSADAVKVKEYLKLHPKVKGQEELPPLDKEDISETQESVDAED